jgi:hypothetical protein
MQGRALAPKIKRSEVVRDAYNPPRWLRSGSRYTLRCEGVALDAPAFVRGHRDIECGRWVFKYPRVVEGSVVYGRACAACGLELLAASRTPRSGHGGLFPGKHFRIAARVATSLRAHEERDAERQGERRLLCALLALAYIDLVNPEPNVRNGARDWFEGAPASFSAVEVARYLDLSFETVRTNAAAITADKDVRGARVALAASLARRFGYRKTGVARY